MQQQYPLIWHSKAFNELTVNELYAILQLRNQVFVVEQECPYLDIDGKDSQCQHLWATFDNKIAAYARIVPAGVNFEQAAIGRVISNPVFRGYGFGRELIQQAINYIEQTLGKQPIMLDAQTYLIKFYQSFGFNVVSEVYLEDNLPHVNMLRADTADLDR